MEKETDSQQNGGQCLPAPIGSRWRPTPETTKAWHDALDWCRLRGEGHDPHHAALANLSEKMERERDDARELLRDLVRAIGAYGDGASMMHPRLSIALAAARKLSSENMEASRDEGGERA